ncbi:aldo/keto reductase [Ruminococcaceae bacterium OttesenSCG-928-I18]|nr:aldo/keto reductase [Ruminococcaceae bacterium OttesenSCG-928-I18]
MKIDSTFALRNGVQIPLFGLGTWRAESGQARQAVSFALQNGYRLIDTAAYYQNEEEVGAGLRDSGIPREHVFVTSKVWIDDAGYDETLAAFEGSLTRLGLDYLDMYMVHWPVKDKYKDTYRALERLYREKRIRVIGVSNFPVRLLREMDAETETGPMVDQLQFHPLYFRGEEYEYGKGQGILIQAWKPLARGRLSEDARLLEMADKHGKTPEQVLLRWLLQLGVGVIPKSVQKQRILQNADVFDFQLEQEEMSYLCGLDKGESLSGLPDGVVQS